MHRRVAKIDAKNNIRARSESCSPSARRASARARHPNFFFGDLSARAGRLEGARIVIGEAAGRRRGGGAEVCPLGHNYSYGLYTYSLSGRPRPYGAASPREDLPKKNARSAFAVAAAASAWYRAWSVT